ncbi:porin [Prosthecomicrobium sp. N25]|uniref:porin n=1 Tax=Prosthecomicrobium sp. N25 TaxID=3129254 RepID=UPI003076DF75
MKTFAFATFTAAALAASSALAADLGRPAPAAVDYVKVCDAYGEGFFYIPGTETCLKIGGYLRVEYRLYDATRLYGAYGIPQGSDRRISDRVGSRARANIQFDGRTNTEYGLLRSFIELQYTVDSGSSTARSEVQKAYVQFGGLTAGRAQSFFDFYLGDHYASVFETAHSDSIVNMLAYTVSFGSGITATLSLEDPTTAGGGLRRWSTAAIPSIGADTIGPYAGLKYPDVVGNVNVTQSWGTAQVMAAAHHVNGIALGRTTPRGVDYFVGSNRDEWGYAVGAGATIKLPMIADGDTVTVQAAYGKGAVGFVSPDWYAANDYVSIARGSRSKMSLTESWSVAGGFLHNWNAQWSTAMTTSFATIDHKGRFWDYDQFDIGGNLVWAPVTGLSIGAELEYKNVDFDPGSRKDRDALVGLLRVQRNF